MRTSFRLVIHVAVHWFGGSGLSIFTKSTEVIEPRNSDDDPKSGFACSGSTLQNHSLRMQIDEQQLVLLPEYLLPISVHLRPQ
jgi:hypothetical protein